MLKTEILKILRDKGDYVSGQELCDSFGVSRTAVWKAVNSLKNDGFMIASVPNRGYRLQETPDVLTKSELESRLSTKWLGRIFYQYDEIDSTNTELKRMASADPALPNGVMAITDNQVAGRGRRGRAWSAPAGVNVAMSFLLKPDFAPDRASMLTILAALAVARGVEETALDNGADQKVKCSIKWPNDVLLNNKKLCGILTEMSSELDFIHYVIVGIGINVNLEEFPEEISDIATSISLECKKKISRASLVDAVLRAYEDIYETFLETCDLSGLMEEYNSRLASMNIQVRVLDPKGEFTGISRGINSEGELIVDKEDGTTELVYAGEVSVRGIYGYV